MATGQNRVYGVLGWGAVWQRCKAYRILVALLGMEPVTPAVEARNFNHWHQEVPRTEFESFGPPYFSQLPAWERVIDSGRLRLYIENVVFIFPRKKINHTEMMISREGNPAQWMVLTSELETQVAGITRAQEASLTLQPVWMTHPGSSLMWRPWDGNSLEFFPKLPYTPPSSVLRYILWEIFHLEVQSPPIHCIMETPWEIFHLK